jgi:outer membrane protein OmpA-like peptidoglycan-associated protein
MKRFILLLLIFCCTGCVNEVVRTVQTLTIRVQPYDTIQTTKGSTIAYDIQSLTEDAALPEATIDVTPSYSKEIERAQTDANGLLRYTTTLPDSLEQGLYSVTFKGHRFEYGSSSTETRFVSIVDLPPPPASVDIIARGVRPDGSIAPEPVSPTSVMHARSSMPLLPYIYFENGKSEIPVRYTRQGSTGFTVQSLVGKNALDANHAVLDIVGQRLKENPQANITLTGTNANAGAEKGNITLSRTRAQQVRDYLVNTWGIEAGRVTVDARNLPEIPTNPVTTAGMEENRRVEFVSDDSRITSPIKIEQRETTPTGETIIRFETTFQPEGLGFKSWRIMLFNNDVQVGQTLEAPGAPPKVQTMTIPNATNLINQPLRYRLEATDVFDRVLTDEGMTRIVPSTVERSNLERFAMLYFDFDRAEINEHARQMLELISESISRDALVAKIDGFTDMTGTEEYNQGLSESRANSAVTSLRAMTVLPAKTDVTGHGERDPKFDNELPEGRQLNRRCEFTIEKSY